MCLPHSSHHLLHSPTPPPHPTLLSTSSSNLPLSHTIPCPFLFPPAPFSSLLHLPSYTLLISPFSPLLPLSPSLLNTLSVQYSPSPLYSTTNLAPTFSSLPNTFPLPYPQHPTTLWSLHGGNAVWGGNADLPTNMSGTLAAS